MSPLTSPASPASQKESRERRVAEPEDPDQTRSQVSSRAGSLTSQCHSVSQQLELLANLVDLPLKILFYKVHREDLEKEEVGVGGLFTNVQD